MASCLLEPAATDGVGAMSMTVTSGIVDIIRGEYQEMPELRLTPAQAARLWNLDISVVRVVLDDLVRSGFLSRWPNGQYGRTGAR